MRRRDKHRQSAEWINERPFTRGESKNSSSLRAALDAAAAAYPILDLPFCTMLPEPSSKCS
jgi:hypothetical protein